MSTNGDVKMQYENVVNDDLTNILSQFNHNFSEYAFGVNVTLIRSFEGL